MQLYDTHCHLTDDCYQEDREMVCQRLLEAGVSRMNLIAYDLPSSFAAAQQAQEWQQQGVAAYAVVGVHPHEAESWNEERERELVSLLQAREDYFIVALGEIGLDYHYDHAPRAIQKEVFWKQLEWAHRFHLPVVLHDREAHQDTLELLRAAQAQGLLETEAPGVVHCYSGSCETAAEFIRMGFYLGFDGPITFKNAKQPCESLQSIPLERLVLETDAPYLTPVPYRGKRNEPAYLPLIAARAAELRGLSLEQLCAQTTENACRLFRIQNFEASGTNVVE